MDLHQYYDSILQAIKDNDTTTFLTAVGSLIVFYVLLLIIKKIVLTYLRNVSKISKTKVDDQLIFILDGTGKLFFFTLSLYLASNFLVLSDNLEKIFQTIAFLGILIQTGFWLNRMTQISLPEDSNKQKLETIQKIIQVAGWIIIVLLAMDNLGIKINSLVASLGITSIAIGLAAQATLTDLISSILINIVKPFEEGDFIIVGDYMGTVENIGWKNTRIRSISGELLIFNNSSLQSNTIQNYQHLNRRRVTLKFGVIYETPSNKIEMIPSIVKDVIENLGQSITFDRAHFAKLGDYSLDFEVIYYIESKDYVQFMDLQQAVNLNLFKRFEVEEIAFAYPTQAIYVETNQASAENSHISSVIR